MKSEELKSLKLGLLSMINELKSWPRGKEFEQWVRDEGRSIRSGKYGDLRNGREVEAQVIANFLEYIRVPGEAAHDDSPQLKSRRSANACLLRFLHDQGVNDVPSMTSSQMMQHICESKSDPHKKDEASSVGNLFLRGIRALPQILFTKRLAHRHIHWTREEKVIGEAVRWFFHDGGSLVSGSDSPADDPVKALEQRFAVTVDQYKDFALNCQKQEPWSLLLSKGKDRRCGISLVLPLKEQAYTAIRSGKLMSSHVTPDDFEVPSDHLVLEVLSVRPIAMGGESIGASTRALSWCVLTQLGVLSRYQLVSNRRRRPLSILGIEGTPDARNGLARYGFKPTGTRMAISGERLCEKVIPSSPESADYFFAMVMTTMGGYFPGGPPA